MRARTSARSAAGTKGQTMTLRFVTSALVVAALPGLAAATTPKHPAPHHAAPQRHANMLPPSLIGSPGVTAPARSLALGIGRGELVTLPAPMTDVFVASDAIADVQVKSGNQLFVFGKTAGETTIYASNGRGDVVWSANVHVGTNFDSIDQMLHMAMPEAHIATATMNNTVLLTGTVLAPEDAAEAERLVKAFSGDKITVISRLKIATPLQVSLHVKIAEVTRSVVRDISTDLASYSTSASGFQYGIGQGSGFFTSGSSAVPLGVGTTVTSYVPNPANVTTTNPQGLTATTGVGVTTATTGTTLAATGKLLGMNLIGALNLAETIGLATTLAEPNLTALSGETAEFLAGGEFPIPFSSGLGTTSIEYKNYGVSLSYTPTVLADGRISLRVRPEVSELTSSGSVTLNGTTIPALTVRRAETTVELGSGQSFMIAGLLSNSSQNTITKMPGAGDIPVLGSLFRSTAYQKGETELVIIVTPYLVTPVDANQIKLPTDGFRSATALQQVLGNMETDGVKGADRPKPTEKPTPQTAPAGQPLGANSPSSTTPAPSPKAKTASASDTQPGFSIQ
jgi:pilus assembly protein CpaC